MNHRAATPQEVGCELCCGRPTDVAHSQLAARYSLHEAVRWDVRPNDKGVSLLEAVTAAIAAARRGELLLIEE